MTELVWERKLELVDSRSAALRSALAAALDERVPGCPDWAGRDLIAHLGEVQRFWGAVVAAGHPDGPPEHADVPDTTPTGDLLDWSEQSTAVLLDALRAAGPDRKVWSWWGPTDADRVARHQVQEAGVHAWDAEDTLGRAVDLLPADLAADGVDEFLTVEVPVNGAWPHDPATVGIGSHRVELTAGGGRLAEGPPTGDAVLSGTPSELILALYGRRKIDTLEVSGDATLARRFLNWFVTE